MLWNVTKYASDPVIGSIVCKHCFEGRNVICIVIVCYC